MACWLSPALRIGVYVSPVPSRPDQLPDARAKRGISAPSTARVTKQKGNNVESKRPKLNFLRNWSDRSPSSCQDAKYEIALPASAGRRNYNNHSRSQQQSLGRQQATVARHGWRPTYFSRENSTFQSSSTRGIVCLLPAAQCPPHPPFFLSGPLLINPALPLFFVTPQTRGDPHKGPSEVTPSSVLSPPHVFHAAVFSRFHHIQTGAGPAS